jgi:phage protein D
MSSPPPLLSSGVVRIDGSALDPDLAALLVLLRVRESVRLPAQAYMRLADPQLAHVDDELLSVGRTVEVLYAPPGGRAPTSVFSGSIESIELELLPGRALIAATAYEPAFVLHQRRRTQVFQNMSSGEVAEQVIAAAGLRASIAGGAACAAVQPFVLQSEETDWQLLWRLADAIDFEVVGDAQTIHFRPAGSTSPGAPLELRAPQQLISFRPRVSAARQVDGVQVRGWDPARAEAIVAEESPSAPDSTPGIARSDVAAVSV